MKRQNPLVQRLRRHQGISVLQRVVGMPAQLPAQLQLAQLLPSLQPNLPIGTITDSPFLPATDNSFTQQQEVSIVQLLNIQETETKSPIVKASEPPIAPPTPVGSPPLSDEDRNWRRLQTILRRHQEHPPAPTNQQPTSSPQPALRQPFNEPRAGDQTGSELVEPHSPLVTPAKGETKQEQIPTPTRPRPINPPKPTVRSPQPIIHRKMEPKITDDKKDNPPLSNVAESSHSNSEQVADNVANILVEANNVSQPTENVTGEGITGGARERGSGMASGRRQADPLGGRLANRGQPTSGRGSNVGLSGTSTVSPAEPSSEAGPVTQAPSTSGEMTVGGNSTVGGAANVGGNLTVGGNLIAGGEVQAGGNVTVEGMVTAANVTSGAEFSVGQGVVATGGVTAGGGVSAGTAITNVGSLTANSIQTQTLQTTGSLAVGETLSSGVATQVIGGATIGGELNSGGVTQLIGMTSVGGSISSTALLMQGTTDIGGNATAGGLLNISGATQVGGGIMSGGMVNVKGSASAEGVVSGSVLKVGSSLSADSVQVGGTLRAGGNVTANSVSAGSIQAGGSVSGGGNNGGSVQMMPADKPTPPLQEVWPIEKRGITDDQQPTLASHFPKVARERDEADEKIATVLTQVSPAQPTQSKVEISPPLRPRPMISRKKAPDSAPVRDDPQPTTVLTEIGELPADLWTFLGEKPPATPPHPVPVVMRSVETEKMPASPSPPTVMRELTEQTVPNPDPNAQSSNINLDEVARQVYAQLKRKLAAELERVRRY